MAKPQYIVQPFVGKNGKLKPGKPVAAGSAGACRAEAERQAVQGGAAALEIDMDDDLGPVGTRVLARFGALPDNFDDNVGA